MPTDFQFTPSLMKESHIVSALMNILSAVVAAVTLNLAIPAIAQAEEPRDLPNYSPGEMSSTLRDMIAFDRLAVKFRERMFILPSELAEAFAPQSTWGRNRLKEYASPWNEAFDTLLSGLRRRDELGVALSPAGLRIPLEKKFLDEVPEYMAIDHLLPNVDANMCDEQSSPPNCYIVLQLRRAPDGRVTLANLRIVAPDGGLVPIPGKVQR